MKKYVASTTRNLTFNYKCLKVQGNKNKRLTSNPGNTLFVSAPSEAKQPNAPKED